MSSLSDGISCYLSVQLQVVQAVRVRDAVGLAAALKQLQILSSAHRMASAFAYGRIARAVLADITDESDVVSRMKTILTRDVVAAEEDYRQLLTEADAKQLGRKAQMSFPMWFTLSIAQNCDAMKATREVVERVRTVLDSLRQRREAIAILEDGIATFDKVKIDKGLAVRSPVLNF